MRPTASLLFALSLHACGSPTPSAPPPLAQESRVPRGAPALPAPSLPRPAAPSRTALSPRETAEQLGELLRHHAGRCAPAQLSSARRALRAEGTTWRFDCLPLWDGVVLAAATESAELLEREDGPQSVPVRLAALEPSGAARWSTAEDLAAAFAPWRSELARARSVGLRLEPLELTAGQGVRLGVLGVSQRGSERSVRELAALYRVDTAGLALERVAVAVGDAARWQERGCTSSLRAEFLASGESALRRLALPLANPAGSTSGGCLPESGSEALLPLAPRRLSLRAGGLAPSPPLAVALASLGGE